MSFIYFFLNVVGLPTPLSWTGLMTIVLVKPVVSRHWRWLLGIGGVLVLYAVVHLALGVNVNEYVKSSIYLAFLLYTCFAAHTFLTQYSADFFSAFRWVAMGAFGLFVLGLLALNTRWEGFFWLSHDFIGDGERVLRFYGLSYEPSHLALTLSPVFLYYLIKIIEKLAWATGARLMAVSIPIALTVSFGFAAALGLTLFSMVGILLITSGGFRKRLLIPAVVAAGVGIAVCSFSNPLSDRIWLIFNGNDTSVNGRTTEAFYLGYKCAETKSIWTGIGAGQVKIVGEDVIRPYYAAWDPVGYSKENWPVIGLPNSMAETLAMYGILGVLIKLAAQIFLFIRFRVHKNYFSLAVFGFMFFYQLMGSFILSTTEMMMWVLAIVPLFPALDVPKTQSP